MGCNTQARKWALVINNPQEAGLDHSKLAELLRRFSPRYFCMGDEIATTGTYHTHIFLLSDAPIRFSTLKNRFPTAHMEKAYGSAEENRDYVRKAGKWAQTDKAETLVPDTFEEWGQLPSRQEEQHPQQQRLIANLQSGMSTPEIIREDPALVFRVRDIDLLRQTLLEERYRSEHRPLTVCYFYGASGAGKTRSIFAQHDPRDICRITNYRPGKGVSFDGYHGQDVLVFEEFCGQVPLEEMLNYLDIYPLYLPARYNDRVACYTQVYLTSNLPLEGQYPAEQRQKPETWQAFLRRIHQVVQFLPDGSTRVRKGALL